MSLCPGNLLILSYIKKIGVNSQIKIYCNYCKPNIFRMYDIWRTLNFLLLSVDLIWHLIFIHIHTFINAQLVMHLVKWRDATTIGTKKNTLPNVITLKYSWKYVRKMHFLYKLTLNFENIFQF